MEIDPLAGLLEDDENEAYWQTIDMSQLNDIDNDDDAVPEKKFTEDYYSIHTKIRVHPSAQLAPYKSINNMWSNPWNNAPAACKVLSANRKRAPGTISCVVKKNGDTDSLFILTVGHAGYDIDPYRLSTVDEDVSRGEQSNRLPDIKWGEWIDGFAVVRAIGPFASSHEEYYRAGDKLGSSADCALMKISEGVLWSNRYPLCDTFNLSHFSTPVNPARKVKLVALDDSWVVNVGPTKPNAFYVRELTIPETEFEYHETFRCNLDNWEGKDDCTLRRALIRRRPRGTSKDWRFALEDNGTSLRKGASGSALIRLDPNAGGAIVVGIFLGMFCKYVEGKKEYTENDITYDVFQHVSVAQGVFGLQTKLPHGEPVLGHALI